MHKKRYYNRLYRSFHSWISAHGLTFGTKEEFERRRQIFAEENR